MAETTIRCNATACTYVDSRYPNSNFNSSSNITINRYCYGLFKFDITPLQNYLKKYTTGFKMYAYSPDVDTIVTHMYFLNDSFNAATVSYKDCIFQDTGNKWGGNQIGYIRMAGGQYIPAKKSHSSLYDQLSIGIAIGSDSGEATFYKSGSAPYIEFTFDDYTKQFRDDDGIPREEQYFNPTKYGTFYIGLPGGYDYEFIRYPNATAASIEYMLDTASSATTKNFTVNVSISEAMLPLSIPSNTFSKQKRYKWRGKYTIESNGETGWTPWYYFITTDSISGPPQNLSPYASYLDGEKPITLSWEHNIATGSDQYAYDLDILQGSTWKSIVNHKVTTAQSYTIVAGTLQSGNMQWRVRTYNTDNVVGEYAQSSISVVQTMPKPPTIISASAYPIRVNIKWQSVDQEVAEMQLLDSGNNLIASDFIYGAAKTWSYKDLLDDGTYTFKVRIQNGQGLWSNYAEQAISVVNTPTTSYWVTYQPINGGMRLSWTKSSPNIFYILRNGKPIGKTYDKEFVDYGGTPKDTYMVREVIPPGVYTDSNISTVPPIIKHAYLSYADRPKESIEIRYRVGGRPERSAQTSISFVEHFFLGREQPCYDAMGQAPCVWQFSYSFLRPEDDATIKQVFEMLASGKPLLYRDWSGLRIYGVCASYSENHIGQYVDMKFSLSECEYQDTISY